MFWVIKIIFGFLSRWFKYIPTLWGSGLANEFKEFLKVREERKHEIEKIKAENSKPICNHPSFMPEKIKRISKKVQEIEAETSRLRIKIILWFAVFLIFWLNLLALILMLFAPETVNSKNILELISFQMIACFGLLGYFKYKEKE